MDWMNAVIQGVLLGGLYALFAAGLSLVFGIMRVVNLAHGDFIILAAFLSVVVVGVTGLGPFLSLVIVVPLMGGLGYAVQRGLLARTLDRGVLPPLLVTFGLSVIIQNLLLQIFSADDRRLDAGGISTASIGIAGQLAIGWFPVVVFVAGVLAIAGLQMLFTRTALGRAFRATADDQETVRLMGIDNRHTYGLAVAIAFGIVALAGVCLGIRTTFSPDIGPGRLLVAFETVVIGGLGSLWGTLMGGVILGIAHTIGAKLDPAYRELTGHLAVGGIELGTDRVRNPENDAAHQRSPQRSEAADHHGLERDEEAARTDVRRERRPDPEAHSGESDDPERDRDRQTVGVTVVDTHETHGLLVVGRRPERAAERRPREEHL